MAGFHMQANGESFGDGSPRSTALWKRVLNRLTTLGFVEQMSERIYEVTEAGFARANREVETSPLTLSLRVTGPADSQTLSVESSRAIRLKRLEFLTSSGASVTSAELDEPISGAVAIPLDQRKIVELFNAPRPDKHHSDHSGPAALRAILDLGSRREEVALPVLLQVAMVRNTQWIQVTGSQTFALG